LVVRRPIVELSNNMLVKVVRNGAVRKHCPANGKELFDQSLREALAFAREIEITR